MPSSVRLYTSQIPTLMALPGASSRCVTIIHEDISSHHPTLISLLNCPQLCLHTHTTEGLQATKCIPGQYIVVTLSICQAKECKPRDTSWLCHATGENIHALTGSNLMFEVSNVHVEERTVIQSWGLSQIWMNEALNSVTFHLSDDVAKQRTYSKASLRSQSGMRDCVWDSGNFMAGCSGKKSSSCLHVSVC